MEHHPDRLRRRLAVVLALFFALQCVEVYLRIPRGMPIFALSYEFGPTSASLLQAGRLADCSYTPCRRANRMPMLPAVLSALGEFSTLARPVAVMKNLFMALATGVLLAWLLRAHGRIYPGHGWAWACLLPLAVLEPILRYSSAIQYEEGLLTEWLPLWTLAFLLSVACWRRGLRDGPGLAAGALALSTLMALTKSSLLAAWFLSLAPALAWAARTRSRWLAAVTVACLLALAAWGARNAALGRFTLGTSWEGENLYRGFNSQSRAIYPYISLDETVFPPHPVPLGPHYREILARGGGGLPLAPGSSPGSGFEAVLGHRFPAFRDEWTWDDFFKARALAWIRAHPGACLRFEARKWSHFFLSLEPAPFEDIPNPAERVWARASVVFGRLGELGWALALGILWFQGGPEGRALTLAAAATGAAYALPYVLVFNYERHYAVFFTLVAASLTVVLAALADLRVPGRGRPGPPG